ncbi:profilin-4 isoform X2 [Electrophorus electricus]|uniref:profilin-4 isoform X2 n=1 Tax=Electrophorus electricus TaxID=8005 RepID=UPI0015D0422B|nr:profilin-4 isoform X2 [Electrophorus electricus]
MDSCPLITDTLTTGKLKAQITHQEAQMFIDAFKYLTIIREQGIFFDEKAFTCVRADRNSIYCKCGDNGLILVKTALFVIVATYNENMYPSVCVEASEKLAEYLREKGK